ncbi:hypothetical protein [uncultured Marinobacter sp.]|jgi:hypothetical protein|uniref:hypothetical protein n=1 Tax=uncultured Marinobacter sp. TaxID=187379 RepID=UPI00258EBCED|nr:hypothetical protein [uncultured Marinobacter sp.]
MFRKVTDSGGAAAVLWASLILAACGGGGSGGSSSSGGSDGDTTSLKAGLYETKVTYANGAPSQKPVTYFSPTSKFVIVFGGDAGLTFGTFRFSGSSISATSTDYRQLDPVQPDTDGFFEKRGSQQGVISGTVKSRESAEFSTADAEGKISTNVEMQRQNLVSGLGISLNRASGTYVMVDSGGESRVALVVNTDGSLDAQYSKINCVLAGDLSIPDTSVNVFDVSFTLSSCATDNRDGEYSGVGFFVPESTDKGRQLVFAAHNGEVAMKFQGTR